eukprot:PhM_4_TR3011/c2_g4_i2/m.89529
MKCAILIALLALVAVAFAASPTGSYCGGISGLVSNINMTVANATKFTITGNALGQQISCLNETYSLDASTGVITLPDASAGNDCLANALKKYGLSTPTITFEAAANDIDVKISVVDLKLKHC